MVIKRSLEKAYTGPFWTICLFAFFGSEPEEAEPEPAEPGFGTELAELEPA